MPDFQKFDYKIVPGWGKLPAAWSWGVISGVACDSQDHVYVFTRGVHPVVIFDRDGIFLDSWGEDVIRLAHGIYIDQADNVYCADRDAHCIYKFTRSGKLQMTIGSPGQPGQEGQPFNIPTDMVVAPGGELYVSDGYANRRVHKFSTEGRLLKSWGTQGTGPGQFALPHSIRIDRFGHLWVCDRDNNRIQIFDTDGNFIKEMTDMRHPDTIYFDLRQDVAYVAELDYQVSVYSLDGLLLHCWGGGQPSSKPGEFLGWPHGIWMDSHRDLYVCEVNIEGRIQKFTNQPVSLC
jgi:DNA-binding beta-propeller fold protein YncE